MNKMLFLIFISFSLTAQETAFDVKGTVTDIENRPLEGTTILIGGTSNGTETDAKGHYTIRAKIGDVLVFSYVGMHSRQIPIENQVARLNVQLFAKVQELDEVEVKKRISKSQKELLAEYPSNKNLIKTSWGILSKDRSSHSMRMVDGSEILPIGVDFLTSLRTHFPNMVIFRETGQPEVFLNRLGQLGPPVIFDVDGFIYKEAPTFIIPSEIDRIAVMQGNGAMIRYGTQGAGGVIIVNTKEKTRVDDLGVERVYDNSDLVDSLTRESNRLSKYVLKTFDFMQGFEKAKSMEKALRIYEEGLKEHSDSPAYYLETATYFWKRWQNDKKAIDILGAAKNSFEDNVELLKILAYFSEEIGDYEMALQYYLEVLKLRSRMAQSHRDVANAQNEMENYEKALLKYARYERGVDLLDTIPYDAYGTDLLMTTESNNIIKLKKDVLQIEDSLDSKIVDVGKTRILMEWNIEDLDLEVQFIDPDDLYVLWNNYNPSDPEIDLARKRGYSSKQFFLDDSLNGDWKLTLNYRYDKASIPLVMKVTTFFDYGLPTQKREFKIFRLYDPESSFHLSTINTIEKTVRY